MTDLPAADRPLFDPTALAQLTEMIGEAETRDLLAELRAELPLMQAQALEANAAGDLTALGRAVHKMASASGVLGWMRLSQASRELEQSCRAGDRVTLPVRLSLWEQATADTMAALDARLAAAG